MINVFYFWPKTMENMHVSHLDSAINQEVVEVVDVGLLSVSYNVGTLPGHTTYLIKLSLAVTAHTNKKMYK